MALPRIVVLGAGLGGTIAAYEIRDAVKGRADVMVVSNSEDYWFVPSNPWVAVRWREPEALRVHLPPVMKKRGIGFTAVGARRVHPAENRLELNDGTSLAYDYLVIATGPDLAFDEIPGFGPEHHTVSICQTDHAAKGATVFDRLVADPKPVIVGAAQGASCFGPAYEFVMLLDTELKRRRVRDRVPITFVTSEPYIGHLGLDGVGDTKGLLESEMRERHIKWITSARITSVEPEVMHIEEVGEDGQVRKAHDLPFGMAMMMPPFRGVPAVFGIEGLTNPRGFILVDRHQRNPTFRNVFAIGVAVAIPPTGPTPVPVGVPKTGFMIESMVTAVANNLSDLLDGREPSFEATWNAICLADFGDGGVAFVAQPQIPPRNTNWSASGKWVHLAKIAFEKYFLGKVRRGQSEPFYEKLALHVMGVKKLKSLGG
ncbi:MAG: NAD(P)/FAD-dependent oxidoreductase [Thermaurantiacus tibetensis]|uniref:NAD(P)/FAD-dependent oxidoreductase n=1 Tax=Thermaurantiacus tibetensis TaxID=2759035 RepID=UPI00188F0384|nr:FAD/NAD(P)-binding oxidoreductase [Thermaurantiacus tibetensis]